MRKNLTHPGTALPKKKLLLFLLLTASLQSHVLSQDFASSKVRPLARESGEKPKQSKSLIGVLSELSVKYGVQFDYERQMLEGKMVHLYSSGKNSRDLDNLLQELLQPLDLKFEKFSDSNYLIYSEKGKKDIRKIEKKAIPTTSGGDWKNSLLPLNSLALTNVLPTHAMKDVIVKGQVSDNQGQALPGVTVILKGSSTGTATDVNGNYTLAIPDGDGTLVFSFIGYLTEEVPISNRTVIDIKMIPDIKALEEVVVVGYGIQKKVSVTGSISSVDAKDLKLPTSNMTNVLAGRLAGVMSVQRSGEPGYSSSEFWIRGFGTFSGGRYPLILVDGVERTSRDMNVLDYLDPEEIENISVLKDASATALYGVRGANGVVLVTTRRGKEGKPSVNARVERGMSTPIGLPKLVNGQQYITLFNEANRNEGKPAFFSPEDSAKHVSHLYPYTHPDVNWVEELVKDWTPNHRVVLNVSGGGKTAKYFINATYFGQSGIWKENSLEKYKQNVREDKYNFRSNVDVNITKTSLLALTLGGSINNYNFPGAAANDMMWSMFRVPPTLFPKVYPNGSIPGTSGEQRMNPYGRLTQRGYSNQFRNSISSTLSLKQDLPFITQGLSLKGTASFDAFNQHFLNKRKNFYTYQMVVNDKTGDTTYVETATGDDFLGFDRHFTGNRAVYLEGLVQYDRTFNSAHNVTAMLVYNQREYFDANADNAINAVAYRRNGLAGRITYAFRDKYFAEANFGYNGSENFPKGKRFGLFPSISAGWLVSEESLFKQHLRVIDWLKLRGSYGLAGNDDIGGRRFVYLATTTWEGNWYYGDFQERRAIKEDEPATNDVSWEIAKKLNAGFEIKLFKSAFSLQADYFHENRTGIFIRRDLMPDIMGYNKRPFSNVGRMRNQGVDLEASYRNKVGKFDFEIRGNYVFARNKVLYREEPANRPDNLLRTGKRNDQQFGLVWDGFFSAEDIARMRETEERMKQDPSYMPTGEDFPLHTFKSTGAYQPGDYKYKDLNRDGKVNSNDETAIGFANYPEYTYGVGLSVRYSGFDLSLWFQGVGNYTTILKNEAIIPFILGGYGSATVQAMDRWHINENGETVEGFYPRLGTSRDANNYQASSRWQVDLSYFRLKTADFGYTIPASITKKLKISNCRLFVNGINLFTWSKFKWWEPDISDEPFNRYPMMQTWNTGVNITF
jgi:TonB-linked SusC/RagA family outer membrane protein